MSPEQALGESTVDRRSDIYSLACVIHEMLAGGPPFTGPSLRAVAGHIQALVPLASEITKAVPRRLSEAAAIGLAKNPSDRFQTALQFASALSGEATGFRRRRDRSAVVRAGLAVAVGVGLTIAGASTKAL
jgi:serine/threonine-protein kinase